MTGYIEDIGSYFLMLKRTFGSFTKRSVLKELILKEIDDLIIGSLGIVVFISFFVGGGNLNTNRPERKQSHYPKIVDRFCHKAIHHPGICANVHVYYHGGKSWVFYHLQHRLHARHRTDRRT